MFKAMILLKKKDSFTTEQFKNWWLNEHSPMASKLPKIKKLCFNLVVGVDSQEYDGIAEQWFDTEEDFLSAYQSEYGKQVAADSMSKFNILPDAIPVMLTPIRASLSVVLLQPSLR